MNHIFMLINLMLIKLCLASDHRSTFYNHHPGHSPQSQAVPLLCKNIITIPTFLPVNLLCKYQFLIKILPTIITRHHVFSTITHENLTDKHITSNRFPFLGIQINFPAITLYIYISYPRCHHASSSVSSHE